MSAKNQDGFKPSRLVKRTPPLQQPNTLSSSCKICEVPDSDRMVQCDKCDQWFHFKCMDVDSNIEESDWCCETCAARQRSRSANSKEVSISSSHNSSASRKLKLEMQRLEEERAMQARRDKEYLDKKYQLLCQEDELRSIHECDQVDTIEQQQERVTDWLQQGDLRQLSASTGINSAGTTKPQQIESVVIDTRSSQKPFVSIAPPNLPIESSIEHVEYAAKQRASQSSNAFTQKPVLKGNQHANNLKLLSSNHTAYNVASTAARFSSDLTMTHQYHSGKCVVSQAVTTSYPVAEYPTTGFVGFPAMTASCLCSSAVPPIMTASVQNSANIIPPNSTVAPSIPCNTMECLVTSSQLAARHAMPKELPMFGGKPEDWPIFIATYENSTRICGLSNEENLVRLQKCLKGAALEAVRSRLMQPSGVPGIISTLRMLYGRPELIINSLLLNLRRQPLPRVDRLDTLVAFALAVQNICATMEASNLKDHLQNPTLLQELTERLPPQIRLNWAIFKQTLPEINILTFSTWIYNVAEAISDVTFTTKFANQEHLHDKYSGGGRVNAHCLVKNDINQDKQVKRQFRATKCPVCNGNCCAVSCCQSFLKLNLSQRWSAVRDLKLCRTCLASHKSKRCELNKLCGEDNCMLKHHRLLHNNSQTSEIANITTSHKYKSHASHDIAHINNDDVEQDVLFRILPVVLSNGNVSIETYAFFDDGSSLTMMEEEIAVKLGLEGRPMPLCLKWTGDTRRTEMSKSVCLKISSKANRDKQFIISNVRTIKNLQLPVQSICKGKLELKYPYLARLPIDSYEKAKPTILIGLNNMKLGLPLKSKEGFENQPIASKTRLGWTVYGSCGKNFTETGHINAHICNCENNIDSTIHQMIKEYFSVENLGVLTFGRVLQSTDERRACEILKSTTARNGNSFEIGLLWRYDNVVLPDSFSMAERRLRCLEKKMLKEPELGKNLSDQMESYVEKGYIRKLLPNELRNHTSRTWYLPIFPVVNPNKPGKIRIVWDAAAKVQGISLKDMLLKGPDQLIPLPQILRRFREKPIAISADIREMFHQIRVREEDQNVQRFLWRNKTTDQIEVFVMNVMTFGATCSPSCAQYVKNINAEEFKHEFPRAYKAIIENHYVDDLLDSVDSEKEAIQLAKDVIFIHSQAGFEIRNWISNSSAVIKALGEKWCVASKNLNISSDIKTEKVLGMWWCTSTDMFTYSLQHNKATEDILIGTRRPTKREVLRTLMSIFDPLGLISNFLVYIKILLQDIWRSQVNWDEQINDNQYEKWMIWIKLLPLIEKVQIPRCYQFQVFDKKNVMQLHTFVDASENAYAAVSYLRIDNGKTAYCVLVAAKTRVAPLKPLSIPRLELQAALIGARLANDIENSQSFEISKRVFWCDSQTVLCWLRSDQKNYRQFVALRVGEILETSNVTEWRWIPSRSNVADEATKWQKNPDLSATSRWFNGPAFLTLEENLWPENHSECEKTSEELKPHLIHREVLQRNPIQPEKFSNWKRLLRSTAFVFRFIHNLRAKINKVVKNTGPLSRDEYMQAENFLYRKAQLEGYTDEMAVFAKASQPDNFKDKQVMVNKSSQIYNQSPYLDENGVLRCRGRIDAVTGVQLDTKRPILLPKDHYITRLVIRSYHVRYHHQNHETVVNELRQRYCIPKLRALLKTERKHCQTCKNSTAAPQFPEMGNLPPARLATFTRPFSFIGIDYFGPMNVTVGRKHEKRWGVLITCLTTRAVHIEVAHTLSTDSCIMSLRNFIARRGTPIEIYSDNATNFHGTEKELKAALQTVDRESLVTQFTNSSMKWLFIPPATPHMGGSWERLVRSVKRILYQIMPTRNPSDELLRNMLIEAENIINSRPLTYIPLDVETDEALTPNHFLLGSSSGAKPAGEFPDHPVLLRKNWMIAQQHANSFWKRWIREYLPDLTRRTKWFQPAKPISKGDIVIIVDENNPRNLWPKGRVINVTKGKDGQVRRATVQTSTGIYERPTVKLAVLDVANVDGKPLQQNDVPGGSVGNVG